jgi:hypothetical protein
MRSVVTDNTVFVQQDPTGAIEVVGGRIVRRNVVICEAPTC